MKRFFREERGYALVLTLLFMPVFLGLSLMIIDVSRGGNAHSDLYAAADALALAGGGELDGGSDAIPRAKAAMEEVSNSVSFLGYKDDDRNIMLDYDSAVSGCDGGSGDFCVIFLDEIPLNDSDPIDQAWVDDHGTNNGNVARYVYVAAQSQNLSTLFPDPVTFVTGSVPIQARAVAGRKSAACGITPLFICNPFEADYPDPQAAFEQGMLHGRITKLHESSGGGSGTDPAGPGNFSFLSLSDYYTGGGASALKEFFSGDGAPECFDVDGTVQTDPGAKTGVRDALNVRFDVWPSGNSYKKDEYVTGKHVRKGHKLVDAADSCSGELDTSYDLTWEQQEVLDEFGNSYDPPQYEYVIDDDRTYELSTYSGYPDSNTMGALGAPGAFMGSTDWPVDTYFQKNHGVNYTDLSPDTRDAINSFSHKGISTPSRHDVYQYEIAQTETTANDMITGTAAEAEDGDPICSTSSGGMPPEYERRLIQAAMVNCDAENVDLNGSTALPVAAFVSLFMVRPWETDAGNTIDVEVVDITGTGGLGTLDTYVRVEAELVR